MKITQKIPLRLYKFMGPSDYTIESLRDGYFFCRTPASQSDLFEGVQTYILEDHPDYWSEFIGGFFEREDFFKLSKSERIAHIRVAIEEIVKIIRTNFTVCSFTEKIQSRYMWDHYAQGSQGVCISIQSYVDLIKTKNTIFGPIKYVESGPKHVLPDIIDHRHLLFDALLTKDLEYNEEVEWRFIGIGKNRLEFSKSMIGEIYFGINCTPEFRESTLKALANNYDASTPVFDMQADFFGGKLMFKQVGHPFLMGSPRMLKGLGLQE